MKPLLVGELTVTEIIFGRRGIAAFTTLNWLYPKSTILGCRTTVTEKKVRTRLFGQSSLNSQDPRTDVYKPVTQSVYEGV